MSKESYFESKRKGNPVIANQKLSKPTRDQVDIYVHILSGIFIIEIQDKRNGQEIIRLFDEEAKEIQKKALLKYAEDMGFLAK